MKRIALLTILITISFTIMSQNKKGQLITTESGLQIKITELGNGEFPKAGDKITAHYTGKLLDGKVFDSSVQRNTPFSFEIGTGQVIKGWDEGFLLISKGAKATFIIPAEIAYGSRSVGTIPANSTLIFDVELLDIQKGIQIEPYNTAGKEEKTTFSGLKYYVIEEGNGPKVETDCNIEFHYAAYFENGKMFDSTLKKGQTLKILAGNRNLIPGLDEALLLMKEGSKYRVIVPPELGFGESSSGSIPANATLTFDLEVVKVNDKIVVEPFDVKGKRVYNHESGLKYIIVKEGDGATPKTNQGVEMHYTGYLNDGTVFDSSIKRNQPFSFVLGVGQVIKGWDIAVSLMKVGDKMRLIIPAELGYGDRAIGNIPPNSELIFDVELLRIIDK